MDRREGARWSNWLHRLYRHRIRLDVTNVCASRTKAVIQSTLLHELELLYLMFVGPEACIGLLMQRSRECLFIRILP